MKCSLIIKNQVEHQNKWLHLQETVANGDILVLNRIKVISLVVSLIIFDLYESNFTETTGPANVSQNMNISDLPNGTSLKQELILENFKHLFSIKVSKEYLARKLKFRQLKPWTSRLEFQLLHAKRFAYEELENRLILLEKLTTPNPKVSITIATNISCKKQVQ